jgi:hypothetical protein
MLDSQVELLCSQRAVTVTAKLMCWEGAMQGTAVGIMRRLEGVNEGLDELRGLAGKGYVLELEGGQKADQGTGLESIGDSSATVAKPSPEFPSGSHCGGRTTLLFTAENAVESCVGQVVTLKAAVSHTPHVEYSLWMTTGDRLTRRFLHDLARTAKQLAAKSAHFTPHYVLSQCSECKAKNFTEPEPGCYSNGRYCQADRNSQHDIKGEEELQEVLRQVCIYNLSGEDKWWDYIYAMEDLFDKDCSDCAYLAMDKASISYNQIEACIDSSTDGTDPRLNDNSLLKAEWEALVQGEVKEYPVLLVNGRTSDCLNDVNCVTDEVCGLLDADSEVCDLPERRQPWATTSSSKARFLVVLIVASLTGIVLGRMCKRPLGSRVPVETDVMKELKLYITDYGKLP